MTVRDAAARLGVSDDTIRREIARGRLTCARIGPGARIIYLTDADLAGYLERCRQVPAAGPGVGPAPARPRVPDFLAQLRAKRKGR